MVTQSIRLLKCLVYLAFLMVGITLALGNRAKIDINLFPFPYSISIPLFMVIIGLFLVGSVFGWLSTFLHYRRIQLQNKNQHKKLSALENELAALRLESLNVNG